MTLTADLLGELAATADRWADGHLGLAELRSLRDADPSTAAVAMRNRWAELADLGWSRLLLDGGGLLAVAAVQRALGAHLAVSPLVPSGVFAAGLLPEELAGAVGDGTAIVAFARARPGALALEDVGGRTSLHGRLGVVPMASVADHLLVVLDRGTEPVAVLVDPDAPSMSCVTATLLDAQPAARVDLDGTLGDVVASGEAVALAEQRALVAQAAAMAGGQRRALDITLEHLRNRHQFGVPIGAFQALQHRAADRYVETELCDALVERAAQAHDTGHRKAPALAHAAKARLADAYRRTAEECLQLHGGIGMTDEAEIGFHLKAALVAEQVLGDAAHHRARFAEVRRYQEVS